eukprot:7528005-Pyramimonas_sp.AAC.1
MPSILNIGLSCRADDTTKKRGRQFAHGCPYLPGDNRIQSGLRVDSEVLIKVQHEEPGCLLYTSDAADDTPC